jgi:hypothetical protein
MLRNTASNPIPGYGKPDWTIDIPTGVIQPNFKAEIKFIHSGALLSQCFHARLL